MATENLLSVFITRDPSEDTGTTGKCVIPGLLECYSLERSESGEHPRIPDGQYTGTKKKHPIHGDCYELIGVKDRTAILIHSANWFFQLLGCISLGASIMDIAIPEAVATKFGYKPDTKMRGVSSSRETVSRFMEVLEGRDFFLVIK